MKEEKVFVEHACHGFRNSIEAIKKEVQIAKKDVISCEFKGVDKGEIIANITLAYRHLEDARMRFGKAMQAVQGGVSVLDGMPYPVGNAPEEQQSADDAPVEACDSDRETATNPCGESER